MSEGLMAHEKIGILDQIPIFANLAFSEKKRIAAVSVIAEYKKNTVIYREGDAADGLYCIVAGRVLVSSGRERRAEDLEYLRRGKYFGIISLLTGERHSVSAHAVNDTIVLKIGLEDFRSILRRIPGLALHFSQTLSKRLRYKGKAAKRVFESRILGILSVGDPSVADSYAFNLGISLISQSSKKAVLVDLLDEGSGHFKEFNSFFTKYISIDTPYFNEESMKRSVFDNAIGIATLRVLYNKANIKNIISALSYLTGFYHFVIVRFLDDKMDEAAELLRQSDYLFIVVVPDAQNLESAAFLINNLGLKQDGSECKLRMVTYEKRCRGLVAVFERRFILPVDIFATLPDLNSEEYGTSEPDIPVVLARPSSEYARALKRIAREQSDCMIGLALGSGAALGLAHVGVLKIIEKEKVPVDMLAGTSMGALIGAFWAVGMTADDIKDIISEFSKPISNLRLADLTWPKMGLIKGREVRRFLQRKLGDKTFYDVKLPFKIIACDIETREEVIIDKGSLVEAVMASVSIPGVFEPVKIDGRLLVDGGIVNPLPVNVLIRSGAAKIMAVNTLPSVEDAKISGRRAISIFDILVNSIQAPAYLLAKASAQNADVYLHPIYIPAGWYEFYKGEEIIRNGELVAKERLDELKALVKEE